MVKRRIAEVPMGMAKWRVNTRFPGVGEHGMSDIVNAWQPGRPWNLSQGREYAGQPITKEERQMGARASDGAVVPMKAGNAAGGKGATSLQPLSRRHALCSVTERTWN
jgi:hypothetical protein